jgi:hypothetical protein
LLPPLGWAVLIAIFASLLLALIEITSKSKAHLRACIGMHLVLYWIVLAFGNVFATLIGYVALQSAYPQITNPPLAAFSHLIYAFVGVFGFEVILKQMNLTMFDQGVLTIQDWTTKASNAAIGAAIEKQERLRGYLEGKLIGYLMTLSEEDINTRVLNKFNDETVRKLDEATEKSAANKKQYKVYQLATALSQVESYRLLSDARKPDGLSVSHWVKQHPIYAAIIAIVVISGVVAGAMGNRAYKGFLEVIFNTNRDAVKENQERVP